jgi:hypothetical protein
VANLVPGQYRRVSVTSVDVPLTPGALTAHFTGREAYRHTRYVVVRNGAGTALIRVGRHGPEPLFAPVTAVEVLALPHECAFVTDLDVDTGVPSALAAAARRLAPGARAVVVEGRYHHVSFVLDPDPVRIRVADVVPPHPPKLVDQAARVLAVAEDLPPVELVPDVLDLRDLARAHPSSHYLVPCRGSGIDVDGAPVSFLDERPPRQPWTMLGCARSRQIHEWFYGDLPEVVDICPRARFTGGGGPLLTKCCLFEHDLLVDGATAVVPWGASLDLVRQALAHLATTAEPAWLPA